ncbi:MAG: D-alanyl-D-alanine carboxypeptidase family protein [Bacillota bacterium]
MKALRLWLAAMLICYCLICFNVTASSAEEPELDLKAEAALLMEVHSGKIIWEMNSRTKLYPASITKIMSLLIVLEQLEQEQVSLTDRVTVSARASSMGGSELFLSEGDIVSLEDLLIGMAVGSANDAAVAVAEHVGGSVEGFVEMMNEKASQLGMNQSHFCNPHGLHDPDHYSTAYDVMLMSVAIMDYPLIHQWATIWMDEHFLKDKIRSGEVYLSNTNRMVRSYQGCDGLKTGFTNEAGNGISVTARRGQTRFLAVVLGSPTVDDRYTAARTLLDYGFGKYKSVPVIDEGMVVANAAVDKGLPQRINIVTVHRLALLLSCGAEETFEKEIVLQPLEPPLQQGQKVGELVATFNEGEQVKVDLVAAEAVTRASQPILFARLLDHWLRFGR